MNKTVLVTNCSGELTVFKNVLTCEIKNIFLRMCHNFNGHESDETNIKIQNIESFTISTSTHKDN